MEIGDRITQVLLDGKDIGTIVANNGFEWLVAVEDEAFAPDMSSSGDIVISVSENCSVKIKVTRYWNVRHGDEANPYAYNFEGQSETYGQAERLRKAFPDYYVK